MGSAGGRQSNDGYAVITAVCFPVWVAYEEGLCACRENFGSVTRGKGYIPTRAFFVLI